MTAEKNPSIFPHVFTLILNWNQYQFTLDCLESLEKSDYPNNTIVVVDNGSTDGSIEILRARYPELTLLPQSKNLGFCEGNNVGIRYALEQGADYIFLLNNDTTVAPDMLRLLVEACEADPQVGMAGPTMFYFDEPQKIAAAGGRVDARRGLFWNQKDGVVATAPDTAPFEEVDYIVSCGVLARRETVQKIGSLDNRYFINGDDIDWGLRSIASGYKVLLVPSAKMWHKISAAMGRASPATTYYTTRNLFLIFGTHLHGWQRVNALGVNWVRTWRTILAWTLRPEHRSMKRHRNANLMALRDVLLRRFGKMGEDVAAVCYGAKR